MKTSEPLRRKGYRQTELPWTSSAGAFRAKTSPAPDDLRALLTERAAASGAKLPVLLASFDLPTSSWRTSQICLLALASDQADGSAEFSETWPSAGMMRSGKTYRLQPWALPIAESVSGSWLTPRASDFKGACSPQTAIGAVDRMGGPTNLPEQVQLVGAGLWPTPTTRDWKGGRKPETLEACGRGFSNSLNDALTVAGQHGPLNPPWVEWLMGFPDGWTDLSSSETP